MSTSPQTDNDTTPTSADDVRPVLRAIWFGVLVGLGIQLAVMLVQIAQDQLPPMVRLAADTVQKISWSALVCAAIAAGQAAARAYPGATVLFGLFGAPVAFLVSRSVHKAMLEAMAGDAGAAAVQWLAAGVKGVEYALVGAAIVALVNRDAGWKPYAAAGAAIGLVTWILTGFLLPAAGNPIQRAVVEILHPVGCTLAVFASLRLGQRLQVEVERPE